MDSLAMTSFGKVGFAMSGEFAVLTIDNPPVNAGSHAVRSGLINGIKAAIEARAKGAVILGAGRCFVAGSDLKEFGKPLDWPEMPDVISALETAPFPVVAALHGVALGGGLELSLGCDYRIASPDTKVGLPEVTLGFIPGAGGTQRLPRLIGRARAIDLICRAARIPASEALEIGLVDVVADKDLLQASLSFLEAGHPKRVITKLSPPDEPDSEIEAAEARALKRGKGRPNIEAAIRLVKASTEPSDKTLAEERAVFQELRLSDDAFALRYLFFSERKAASVDGLDMALAQSVARIGVVGGGTMGQGIVRAFLAAGISVTMVERDVDALSSAQEAIAKNLDAQVAKGRLRSNQAEARWESLSGAVDMADLADCDLVIEAVFEDLTVKKNVLAQLEAVLEPDAIIATNTSYLDIDSMVSGLQHPERVLGLHFFSPADIMKLLEVVRAENTSDAVLATGLMLARKLGKQPVVARVGEGFIGNRIYAAYRRRAELLVLDGATPQAVDDAATAFGFAMGPFAVADLSGLDIAWAMRKRQAATRDPKVRYVTIPDRLCEAGRLGRKTGQGWYDYASGKPKSDPVVDAIIDEVRGEEGIVASPHTPEKIQRQLMAAIVNEAACLLGEGIAARASDVDVALTNGYGFPRWRGGPLYWATRQNQHDIQTDLDELAVAIGHGHQAGPVFDILKQIKTEGKS